MRPAELEPDPDLARARATLEAYAPRDKEQARYRARLLAWIERFPADALPLAGPNGPPDGLDPAKLEGIVVDDVDAKLDGDWKSGTGLKNYVGYGYRYAPPNSGAVATFTIKPTKAGRYIVQVFSQSHANRATNTPVSIRRGDLVREYRIDQRTKSNDDILSVGDEINVSSEQEVSIAISTDGADGNVHVDAVRLLEVK